MSKGRLHGLPIFPAARSGPAPFPTRSWPIGVALTLMLAAALVSSTACSDREDPTNADGDGIRSSGDSPHAASGGAAGYGPVIAPEVVREVAEAGVAVFVGHEMIRGYDPTAMLVTPETIIVRARFPVVDVHCHWWLGRRSPSVDAVLAAMDEMNIAVAVNLSGGWGDALGAMLAWCAAAPERLLVFANIDFSRIDEPAFGDEMTAFLRDAKSRGVRGLKIFKDLGLTIRDGSGALVPVDDPRLDPIWRACAELELPVLIHSGDPAAFFEPVDERNERWMQLKRHPSWSFHGDEFPDREEVFAQRERLFARHPGTTFIAAHLGDLAEDLERAGALLDAHPNVVMDISGRVAELGRQPYSARRFLIRYQDRVLFGTDRYPGRPDQPRERIYFRFLETDDQYFKYHDHPFPPTGEWRIHGVFLPDEALRKIYFENAARVLGIGFGEAER